MADTVSIPSYKDDLANLTEQLGKMLPTDKLAVFNNDAVRLGGEFNGALPLKPGDHAPLFTLPNARGNPVGLQELLRTGPVVLTFYRGVWCPYCNLQLRTYQQILPQISEAGAKLVALSPMTPDKSVDMVNGNDLTFEVLSDAGNKIARRYTQVLVNPPSSITAMSELGYDFHAFYADKNAELPMPATFVIAQNGKILFAGSEGGDYRRRIEPVTILNALNASS